MRYGFTTGSCAAAAAKAAAYMLFSGCDKNHITIITPKGIPFEADIIDITRGALSVSCAVVKDGGDDPDVTTGLLICAKVSILSDCFDTVNNASEGELSEVIIKGGEGVGIVTKPGLDQKVGEAAINSVPRSMITKEVTEVMELFDFIGKLQVEITVPGGRKTALKTFNPRLGIVDGISILGTSGIVEPMSTKAILDTIQLELRQKKALGHTKVVVTPGNYGLSFLQEEYSYDIENAVKISNFVGESIDMAVNEGYESMLLVGHIGKLIKLSGGIMNTHSKEGDCRMELLCAAACKYVDNTDILRRILECISTEEAIKLLDELNIRDKVMSDIVKKMEYYVNHRGGDNIRIECITFSNELGLLGTTDGANALLEEIQSYE